MAALLIERGAELTPVAAAALGRWDYLASCPHDSLQGKGVLQRQRGAIVLTCCVDCSTWVSTRTSGCS